MQISGVILVLYLAHGQQVSAQPPITAPMPPTFIGGRPSCGANRAVTASSFASSNCYRLTNANAKLACSRNYNKPIVVNTGTSIFSATCNDPILLEKGPRFGLYGSANLYYPDLQLVSSDSNAALLGLNQYLVYDPMTGYMTQPTSPPYDMTQVYSFVLINKLTGATSDPVYFTVKLGGCSLVLAGPSSATVCTGSLPVSAISPPAGTAVATFTVCSTVITGSTFDSKNVPVNCPTVSVSSNTDITPCYIFTSGFPDTVGNYVLGAGIPLVKFTQTFTITATPVLPDPGNIGDGSRFFSVTFDPTCTAPTVSTAC